MTAERIRKAQDQTPCKPYHLYLSDQRTFPIEHPEFLWVVPGGRNIAIADSTGAIEVIDLIQITSLKIDGAKAS